MYCTYRSVPKGLFIDVYHNLKKTDLARRGLQTISLEKSAEKPVIVISEYDSVDVIGPPDSISNLRPVIRGSLITETRLQRRLRESQDATQEWNQRFWSEHNSKFTKERQNYVDMHFNKTNVKQLTAEEMSEFYKQFLDDNWRTHVTYNMEWYRKNFSLLSLAFQVQIEKMAQKLL
ncbi:hypothetical protein NQ315_003728 [Exocentrus adspersus]|uniref:Apoptogenic protein 1, mitochondrial n=1 Tax=Exocentrus adspersus TaxID=1586481 RepID=A0AAV8VI63_9CUCU|nr:hypothetical protein NQ315_003728 [Exocentrus adspersus]